MHFSVLKEECINNLNIKENGVYDRVTQLKGDAKDVLATLSGKYDFIFLDGPKGQYIRYLPMLENLLNFLD